MLQSTAGAVNLQSSAQSAFPKLIQKELWNIANVDRTLLPYHTSAAGDHPNESKKN
jgi:hypothetical protein